MPVSQNGYIANDIDRTRVWTIPGADRRVRLRFGAPGLLLVELAAFFDMFVEPIDVGQLDDWGYAERPIRGGSSLSNHASGTAIDLNATRHPLGKRGTFDATQEGLIRSWLRGHNGCVRGGGDYKNRADEMHFEIVKDVDDCRRALRGS